jgi:hypothetical protein
MITAQENKLTNHQYFLSKRETKKAIEKEFAACEETKPKGPPQPSTTLIPSNKWHGLALSNISLNNFTDPKSAKKINIAKENKILTKSFWKFLYSV